MASELQKNLDSLKAYRETRLKIAHHILDNPNFLDELITICFTVSDKNSHKACWILEFVSYEKLKWLQPYMDFYCENIGKLKDESAIRPMAKVCQLLVTSHFKNKEIQLSENHLQKITETCFDWLINDTKVASKCYSIRTLYVLGKHFDWIHPELQIILEQNYTNHSAAYKAVAREILKKIKWH
ncbi:hypothetical protein [Flavobacterium sp. GT3P67]|uniref:hypothetical protein n=1 Tax=Flavobacterium sp. GT3P67 TaxID=2541722 RepID=UPI0010525764|nr:hypothetical protein [Flavobacterium sp. GT3P67]TDE51384.1 hypothetical protein E0H99_12315 [Flavobacterium sp. GT3P67]